MTDLFLTQFPLSRGLAPEGPDRTILLICLAAAAVLFAAGVLACVIFRHDRLRPQLFLLTGLIGILLVVILLQLPSASSHRQLAEASPPAPEETLPLDLWYADCNEFITLRVSPSVEAEAVTTIPVGAEMNLIRWEGDFGYVDYRGQRGYVLASYIQPSEGPEAIDLTFNGGTCRATLREGLGYSLYVPVTGWQEISENGSTRFQQEAHPLARLTLQVCVGRSPEQLRRELPESYPDFSLISTRQGGLGGVNGDQTLSLEVFFFPMSHGTLAAVIQCPLDQAETLGYALHAMVDTIQLSEG